MNVKDIEDAVSVYTALAMADAKAFGCTRGSVSVECTTRDDYVHAWRATAAGWTGSECTIACSGSGESPVQALASAHRTFWERLAEQAEEVTE